MLAYSLGIHFISFIVIELQPLFGVVVTNELMDNLYLINTPSTEVFMED